MRKALIPLLLFLAAPGILRAEVSILRGQAVLNEKVKVTIPLPRPVDTTRSLLLHSLSAVDPQPYNVMITVTFLDPQTLVLQRTKSNGSITVNWQVLEFSSGVRVQRGTLPLKEGIKVYDVPLNPVNLSKTVAMGDMRSDGSALGSNEYLTTDLTSEKNLRIELWDGPGDAPQEVVWQVWEYAGATVQKVKSSLPTGESIKSFSIAPVDPAQSIILGGIRNSMQWLVMEEMPSFRLNENGSAINLQRYRSKDLNVEFLGYVMEFNDGTQVIHRDVKFEKNDLRKAIAESFDIQHTALFIPGDFGRQGRILESVGYTDKVGLIWFSYEQKQDSVVISRSLKDAGAMAGLQMVSFASAPSITTQPQNQSVTAGSDALFSITATGQNLKYQWLETPGNSLSGAISAQLSLPSLAILDSGRIFYCRVTNGTDTVFSETAALSVTSIPGTPIIPKDTVPQPGPILTDSSTLKSGEKRALVGDTLIFPSGGANVTIEILGLPSSSLIPRGFAPIDTSFSLEVKGGQGPEFLTWKPRNGTERSIYRIDQGKAYFISPNGLHQIQAPGVYFVARDTDPPHISLGRQQFSEGDSLRITFTVSDNVENLRANIARSDDPKRDINNGPRSPGEWTFTLKNPSNTVKPLELRLEISDGSHTTCFPVDCKTGFPLPQRFGKIESPAVLAIGTHRDSPWDLVGLPFHLDPGLNANSIFGKSDAADTYVSTWDATKKNYRPAAADTRIKSGTALWVAAPNSLQKVTLDSVQTQPFDSTGTVEIRLSRGWNQVSSPHLRTKFWPVSRSHPGYPQSSVKGLHAYDAKSGGFQPVDSLQPWRGYFVYSNAADTIVRLSHTPPSTPSAKVSSQGPLARLELTSARDWEISTPLFLSAREGARDGLGIEDEFLPASPTRGLSLFSRQSGARLSREEIPFTPDRPMRWEVIVKAGDSQRSQGPLSLRVVDNAWPEGYAAVAFSRTRRISFALQPLVPLELSRTLDDTLDVWLGSMEQLRSGGFSVEKNALPENFTYRLNYWAGEPVLILTLSNSLDIRARLYTSAGSLLSTHGFGLAPGHYRLPIGLPSGLNRRTQTKAGPYFLRLDVDDGRGKRNYALPLLSR